MILFGVRLEQSQLLPSTYYGESAGVYERECAALRRILEARP